MKMILYMNKFGKLCSKKVDEFDEIVEGVMKSLGKGLWNAATSIQHPHKSVSDGRKTDNIIYKPVVGAKKDMTFNSGGTIIFSTDVTSNPFNADEYKNSVDTGVIGKRHGANWSNLWNTFLNHLTKKRKILQAMERADKAYKARKAATKTETDPEDEDYKNTKSAYKIGKHDDEPVNIIGQCLSVSAEQLGMWKDTTTGTIDSEASFALTFLGLKDEIIQLIAKELMDVFHQQGVVIHDRARNHAYLYLAER